MPLATLLENDLLCLYTEVCNVWKVKLTGFHIGFFGWGGGMNGYSSWTGGRGEGVGLLFNLKPTMEWKMAGRVVDWGDPNNIIRWPRRAIPIFWFLDFYFWIDDFQNRISKIVISSLVDHANFIIHNIVSDATTHYRNAPLIRAHVHSVTHRSRDDLGQRSKHGVVFRNLKTWISN